MFMLLVSRKPRLSINCGSSSFSKKEVSLFKKYTGLKATHFIEEMSTGMVLVYFPSSRWSLREVSN